MHFHESCTGTLSFGPNTMENYVGISFLCWNADDIEVFLWHFSEHLLNQGYQNTDDIEVRYECSQYVILWLPSVNYSFSIAITFGSHALFICLPIYIFIFNSAVNLIQVISTARTCNCILIVLDAIKPITHKRLIEKELEGFGIR